MIVIKLSHFAKNAFKKAQDTDLRCYQCGARDGKRIADAQNDSVIRIDRHDLE